MRLDESQINEREVPARSPLGVCPHAKRCRGRGGTVSFLDLVRTLAEEEEKVDRPA